MPNHNGPMTDTHLQALRRRNELRLHQSREQLGERWLLHPANAVRPASLLFKNPVRIPISIDMLLSLAPRGLLK